MKKAKQNKVFPRYDQVSREENVWNISCTILFAFESGHERSSGHFESGESRKTEATGHTRSPFGLFTSNILQTDLLA